MIDEKLIISHHTGLYDYIDAENIVEGKYLPSEINKNSTGIDKALLLEELLIPRFLKIKVSIALLYRQEAARHFRLCCGP